MVAAYPPHQQQQEHQQQYQQQQQQHQYVDPNHQQLHHPQHQPTMDANQQHQHQPQEQFPPAMEQQQYQPQQQMMPNMGAAPLPESEWNASFCSCAPCGGCLLATCLPCILMGKTSERLVDPSLSKYDVFNPDCLIMGGITYIGLGFIYAMIKRMEIRERFGIKGSGFGDFCASYWCPCCVVLQNDNEVRSRVGEPGKPPVAQGYQENPGMAMPSPPPGKN